VNAPQSAIWLSRDPELYVFGFEPVSQNIQTILRGDSKWPINLDPYLVDKRFKIVPCALGSSVNLEGQKMFVTLNDPGCSSLQDLKVHAEIYQDIKKVETCDVETINLDEFLDENNLETNFDLISLDTQGHDYEILSTSELIFNSKIIVIETAKVELYEGQKIDDEIEEFLNSKGYTKHYYHAFHSTWGDALYFKN
jgi:FkbM family methyltransferase